MNKDMKARATEVLMMTIPDVAKAMQVSDRQITRLRNEGRMPTPVKLGASVRWPRRAIQAWIDNGCPALAV